MHLWFGDKTVHTVERKRGGVCAMGGKHQRVRALDLPLPLDQNKLSTAIKCTVALVVRKLMFFSKHTYTGFNRPHNSTMSSFWM